MPGETEQILLPYRTENEQIFLSIDKMMRQKKDISVILEMSNQIILKEGFGFSDKEVMLADSIWKKLSARRLNRKK